MGRHGRRRPSSSRPPRAAPSASSTRTRSTACWASTSADDIAQRQSGIRAIINSALVSYERLPMLEIVFDRLVRLMTTSLAQLHLRQRRGQPRQHHLDPLRRLSELDSAARHPGGVPGRGAGQLRPADGQFQPDLFDRRRAAGRPPRPAAMRIEGRPYTTIERILVQRMVEVVLADAEPPSSR